MGEFKKKRPCFYLYAIWCRKFVLLLKIAFLVSRSNCLRSSAISFTAKKITLKLFLYQNCKTAFSHFKWYMILNVVTFLLLFTNKFILDNKILMIRLNYELGFAMLKSIGILSSLQFSKHINWYLEQSRINYKNIYRDLNFWHLIFKIMITKIVYHVESLFNYNQFKQRRSQGGGGYRGY